MPAAEGKLNRQVSAPGQPSRWRIGANRDSFLGIHRVGTCAEAAFDAQVALDPAEEQPDAPSHLVKQGTDQCRVLEIVGQEKELSAGFQFDVSRCPMHMVVVEADAMHAAEFGMLMGFTNETGSLEPSDS